MIMKKIKVFLSSTYDDLQYERRFISNKLRNMGYELVWMEKHLHQDFNWSRWSTNQSAQCDVYLQIYDNRYGSIDNYLGGVKGSTYVSLEELHAGGFAYKYIYYRLERPFPDQDKLYNEYDKKDYQHTLTTEDKGYRSHHKQAAGLIDGIKISRKCNSEETTVIHSVSELEKQLESDMRINTLRILGQRFRIWRFLYNDNIKASWRYTLEDEELVEHTSKLGTGCRDNLGWDFRNCFGWQLRERLLIPAILFLIIWSGLNYYTFTIDVAIIVNVSLIIMVMLLYVAYSPSFIRIGTKSILARGAFAFWTIQYPIDANIKLTAHWGLLEDYLTLGALSIVFPDKRKIFVPFVNNPSSFVDKYEKLIEER